MNQPRQVSLAINLCWMWLFLSAVYSVGGLLYVNYQFPAESIPKGYFVVFGVITLVTTVVSALIVYFLAKGFGWLRWMYVIGLASTIGLMLLPNSSVVTSELPLGVEVRWMQLVVHAVIVWLLFQSVSGEWYVYRKSQRT